MVCASTQSSSSSFVVPMADTVGGGAPVPIVLGRTSGPQAGSIPATGRPTGKPFHVLSKPTGPICNLDCSYCFFLDKEALYPGDRFRMSDQILEAYLSQYLAGQPDGEVVIAWQGGEPTLMGVDFFKRATALADRFRRPRQVLTHTIQTNGTLLTDEWADFLADRGFLVGLSVDGPAEMHDAYRVDKRGGPTFDRVVAGLRRLQERNVDVNVLCTVHAANQAHPLQVYRYFRDDLGLMFHQYIPIVEPDPTSSNGVSERTVDPVAWGHFLVALFDEWVVNDVGSVYVQLFDASLATWCGLESPLCIFRETCGDALALGHSGDLHSCDHFVDPEHLLGNIMDTSIVEMVASPLQRAFGQSKADRLSPTCRSCEVRFACHGECPKNRFAAVAGDDPDLNYLCAGYKQFFTHVDAPMRRMATLVRSGRFADEIMGELTTDGRYDRCPCGSGRLPSECHDR